MTNYPHNQTCNHTHQQSRCNNCKFKNHPYTSVNIDTKAAGDVTYRADSESSDSFFRGEFSSDRKVLLSCEGVTIGSTIRINTQEASLGDKTLTILGKGGQEVLKAITGKGVYRFKYTQSGWMLLEQIEILETSVIKFTKEIDHPDFISVGSDFTFTVPSSEHGISTKSLFISVFEETVTGYEEIEVAKVVKSNYDVELTVAQTFKGFVVIA